MKQNFFIYSLFIIFLHFSFSHFFIFSFFFLFFFFSFFHCFHLFSFVFVFLFLHVSSFFSFLVVLASCASPSWTSENITVLKLLGAPARDGSDHVGTVTCTSVLSEL